MVSCPFTKIKTKQVLLIFQKYRPNSKNETENVRNKVILDVADSKYKREAVG